MSKSARKQARVLLCKTHTESKKTRIFKEELIFKRTVASSQTSSTPGFTPRWVAACKLQALHILSLPTPHPQLLPTPQLFKVFPIWVTFSNSAQVHRADSLYHEMAALQHLVMNSVD